METGGAWCPGATRRGRGHHIDCGREGGKVMTSASKGLNNTEGIGLSQGLSEDETQVK